MPPLHRETELAIPLERTADALRAMRAMTASGESWLAIYHSHVRAPASPSPTDLDEHAYPDAIYVIVAPAMVDTERLRAFLIRNRKAEELPLKIVAPGWDSNVSTLQQC